MYILMPIAFIAIGYGLSFFCGKNAVTMMKDQITMAMTKGAPDYPNGFDQSMYKKAVANGSAEQWSEVPLPALYTSYAVISSETLGLQADVYYGDSEECFSKGAGQYTGSHLFGCGKPILLGGHDTTYFAPLQKAKQGDQITVQTNYGEYIYEVVSTKVAKATDTTAYDLDAAEETLTLYTCYPFGKVSEVRDKRFFVTCRRVDKNPVIKEVERNE